MCGRLQPYVRQAATLCAEGCNPMCQVSFMSPGQALSLSLSLTLTLTPNPNPNLNPNLTLTLTLALTLTR